jgi:serine phosphatase RsbU (regulator of sigma subunit)
MGLLRHRIGQDPLVDTGAVGLAARYIPGGDGMNVGGDWYDSFQLPDGRLALIIGDVVGRGVGGPQPWVSFATPAAHTPTKDSVPRPRSSD